LGGNNGKQRLHGMGKYKLSRRKEVEREKWWVEK